MPAMPRTDKRVEKLAFRIIGKPANMRSDDKDSKKEKKIDARLVFEETIRVR